VGVCWCEGIRDSNPNGAFTSTVWVLHDQVDRTDDSERVSFRTLLEGAKTKRLACCNVSQKMEGVPRGPQLRDLPKAAATQSMVPGLGLPAWLRRLRPLWPAGTGWGAVPVLLAVSQLSASGTRQHGRHPLWSSVFDPAERLSGRRFQIETRAG
jgi:hypothetical protein